MSWRNVAELASVFCGLCDPASDFERDLCQKNNGVIGDSPCSSFFQHLVRGDASTFQTSLRGTANGHKDTSERPNHRLFHIVHCQAVALDRLRTCRNI
jgi:hypothetical protein